MNDLRARAASLDAQHAATDRRDAFGIPEGVIYLDGNSLGAMPYAARDAVAHATSVQWGERLIRSWNEYDWWGAQERVGDQIGVLVGAAAGQIVASDSTSINLVKVYGAAAVMRPGRDVVLVDPASFPTDLYTLATSAKTLGWQVERVAPEQAPARIRELGDRVALASYSSVDYRTGELWDLPAITAAAHEVGALMCWDLCHSAGALPIELDTEQVDFAVGCGYKYLNGGPGAPAFIYVAHRHIESFENPLSGWHGHAAPFEMGPDYIPAPGIARARVGTPPLLSLLGLEGALTAYDGLSMTDVRARSLSLTSFFREAIRALGVDAEVITPAEDARRGSQVSLAHDHAYAAVQRLIEAGVIGDFRMPNVIRFGFAPLYLSHADVLAGADIVAEVLADPQLAHTGLTARATVT